MADNKTKSKKVKTPNKLVRYLSHEAILDETGPAGFSSGGIGLIVLLIFLSIAWSDFVVITTSATTQGTAVPVGEKRIVQHLDGGIIAKLNVKEGDLVQKGDILMSFEPTIRMAELNQIKAREAALSLKVIRLKAFINNEEADFSAYEEEYPTMVKDSKFALAGMRKRIEGQEQVFRTRIEHQEASVDVFKKQVISLKKQLKLVQEATKMRAELFESGHGSRVNLISAQLDLAKVQGSLTEAEVNIYQAQGNIKETESKIFELNVKERGKALDDLEASSASLAEVRENLQRLEDKVKRLDVYAPVTGQVHGLKFNSVGEVVEPAQVILSVVPLEEQIIIQNRIMPSDVGHIRVGQKTKITITGFDVRRYGTVEGVLTQISPTTFLDEKGEPYFEGRIALNEAHLVSNGIAHQILPGMTVQANIITGDKTLLEYLTRPVYVALVNAFRER